MKKQVGKSNVFTKESLRKLQDKMRVLCIESFNKEYGLTNTKKGIIKGDTFNELKDKYNFSKEHDGKEKDDFEIEF